MYLENFSFFFKTLKNTNLREELGMRNVAKVEPSPKYPLVHFLGDLSPKLVLKTKMLDVLLMTFF